jgi:hypothetical protein
MNCGGCFLKFAVGVCPRCFGKMFCGKECHREHVSSECVPFYYLIGAGGKRKMGDNDLEEEEEKEKGDRPFLKRRVDLFDEALADYKKARDAYELFLKSGGVEMSQLEKGKRMQELQTAVMRATVASKRGEVGADERLRLAKDAFETFKANFGSSKQKKQDAENRLQLAQDALRKAYEGLPESEKEKRVSDLPLYDLYEGSERISLVSELEPTQVLCLPQWMSYTDPKTNAVTMRPTGFLRCYNIDGLTLYMLTKKTEIDPLSQQEFTGKELLEINSKKAERLDFIYRSMFQQQDEFEKYFPIYFHNYKKTIVNEDEFAKIGAFAEGLSDETLAMVLSSSYQTMFKYEHALSLDKRSDSFWKVVAQWIEGREIKIGASETFKQHVERFRNQPVFLFTQPLHILGAESTTEYIYPDNLELDTIATAFRNRLRAFTDITIDTEGKLRMFYEKAVCVVWWRFTASDEVSFIGDTKSSMPYSYVAQHRTFLDRLTSMAVKIHTNSNDDNLVFMAPGNIIHITFSIHYNSVTYDFGPLRNPEDVTTPPLIPADTDPYLAERIFYNTDFRYTDTWSQILDTWKEKGYNLLVKADAGNLNMFINVFKTKKLNIKTIVSECVDEIKLDDADPDYISFEFLLIPEEEEDTVMNAVIHKLSIPSWEIVSEEETERFFDSNRSDVKRLGLSESQFLYANVTGTIESVDVAMTFPELNMDKVLPGGRMFDNIEHYELLADGCGISTKTTISVELFYPSSLNIVFNDDVFPIPLSELTWEWFNTRFSRTSPGPKQQLYFVSSDKKVDYFESLGPLYNAVVIHIHRNIKNNIQGTMRLIVKWSKHTI